MAELRPARLIVPTRESPDLVVPTAVSSSSNIYGLSPGFSTSTKIPLAPVATSTRAKTTSSVSTRKPLSALTSTVVTGPDGQKVTVVGHVIPMSTHDEFGRMIKSGIANGRTTVPIEPTALAAYSPNEVSHTAVSTSNSDANKGSETAAAASASETSSSGLSSGQLAAAIVVPILVVLVGASLGFLLLRRRKRRQQASATQPLDEALSNESKRGAAIPGMEEKMQLGLPIITSTTQHNYNTGLDSVAPSTTSGSGSHGNGSRLPTYARNQHGGSNLSNPFTDGSGASSRKDSDAFAGFSGAGTDRSSSSHRDSSPARVVSPVPEVDTRQARQHTNDDNDDAVSDMSDDADYQDGDVQVVQAHMGRAHRASVITMRGTGSGASPRGSASGSPEGGSPTRDA